MNSGTPKMMLAFVVRQCAVELGHVPDAAELAEWANNRRGFAGSYRVFGRAISIDEAKAILRSPERMVSIHPDWEARRAPARFTAQPANVIQLRPSGRLRQS